MISLTVLAGQAGIAGEPDTVRDPLAARVDAVFADLARPDSPGCVVGIVHREATLLERSYGMADLEHSVPLSPRSVMELASESKQFTAAAVLLAADSGRLALDDDIRRHVPELTDPGHRVTLRQMLHHTAGLRDYTVLTTMQGASGVDLRTRRRVLDLLARQRTLNFRPGDEHSYSNSGYFLAAIALERTTGMSLRDFARERIFEPLGMHATRFRDDHLEIVKERATGHVRRGSDFGRFVTNDESVGAGGLLTTLEDVLRWERNFHDDRLAGGTLVDRLLERGKLNDGTRLSHAMGLILGDYDGLVTVSHGGSGAGFRTMILRFPQLRLSVVGLCNLMDLDLPRRVWRTAIPYLHGPFAEETARFQLPVPEAEYVDLPDELLRRFVGAYRNVKTRAVWRVEAREGGLSIDTGVGQLDLRPLGETHFRTPGYGPLTVIDFAADGSRMRVDAENEQSDGFEQVKLVVPEPAALAGYAGRYRSAELDVTWTLFVRDGQLFLDGEEPTPLALEPTIADEFALGADLVLRFVRSVAGTVSGFEVHSEQVRGILFDRVEIKDHSP
jgi:CubicO group peptidase (beta-lactamase class C family)